MRDHVLAATPLLIAPLQLLFYAWLFAAIAMVVAWLIQRSTHNAAIVDVVWCGSFALTAVGLAFTTDGDLSRRLLVAALAAAYGSRLAIHALTERILWKPEDARYRKLRHTWGGRAQFYFFLLFQGEALLIPVFSLSLLVLMQNGKPSFSLWEWAGVLVWAVAITGEWAADHQLSHFRANPQHRGKTCRQGLWRYSRHPNYFFESLHWGSYVLMSVGVPHGWVTLVAPILMTTALLKVSGIPFNEAQALATRGDDYRDYQRTTSAFIPWFPKKK